MQRAGKPVNVGNHIPYIVCMPPAAKAAPPAIKDENSNMMDIVPDAAAENRDPTKPEETTTAPGDVTEH